MDELTAKLVLFSELGEESILSQLASVYRDWKQGAMSRAALAQRVHHQVKRLLDLATQYGFDENLWQDYLTFLLLTTENSFSLTAERVGVSDGSILHFAMADLAVFRRLFCWDFASFEAALGLDCFQVLTHYRAIAKPERAITAASAPWCGKRAAPWPRRRAPRRSSASSRPATGTTAWGCSG